MNIPCKNAVTCPQDGNPLLGFSSEAPDIPQFIAVSFSPSVPVPLNFKFKDTGYVVFAQSPLDQETANLAAQVQGVEAFADNLTAPSGGPVATFYSAEIAMQGTCPDGSLFTYGIAASAFAALSQAEADYQAGTYAAQQMALTMLCLSSLEQTVLCLDAGYDATITAMGSSLAQPPDMNNWEVTAGSLPPGLTFNTSTGVLSGTPTTNGIFSFTFSVTDSASTTVSITCTIPVLTQWIVQSVRITDTNRLKSYKVTAISGATVGDWRTALKYAINGGQ